MVSVKESLPGIVVMGWYRPHWRAKDPGELKPSRRKMMYQNPMSYQSWLLEMQDAGLI